VSEYPKAEIELMAQVDGEKEALELRLRHFSYADIADIQQVSIPTVRARIRRAIQHRLPEETRRQARQMECARIDGMQRFNQLVMMSDATSLSEKLAAQAMFYRGIEQRCKLLGLYMPVELDVKYSGVLDQEIETLMSALGAQATEMADDEAESPVE